jgi:hypothetical protein
MVELNAPTTIRCGEPFSFAFKADSRVAGRLRLTSGTDLVPFTLKRPDREPETAESHRIRGRQGTFTLSDFGDHPTGTELVLRFEGAKLWLTVG